MRIGSVNCSCMLPVTFRKPVSSTETVWPGSPPGTGTLPLISTRYSPGSTTIENDPSLAVVAPALDPQADPQSLDWCAIRQPQDATNRHPLGQLRCDACVFGQAAYFDGLGREIASCWRRDSDCRSLCFFPFRDQEIRVSFGVRSKRPRWPRAGHR